MSGPGTAALGPPGGYFRLPHPPCGSIMHPSSVAADVVAVPLVPQPPCGSIPQPTSVSVGTMTPLVPQRPCGSIMHPALAQRLEKSAKSLEAGSFHASWESLREWCAGLWRSPAWPQVAARVKRTAITTCRIMDLDMERSPQMHSRAGPPWPRRVPLIGQGCPFAGGIIYLFVISCVLLKRRA